MLRHDNTVKRPASSLTVARHALIIKNGVIAPKTNETKNISILLLHFCLRFLSAQASYSITLLFQIFDASSDNKNRHHKVNKALYV